VATVLIVDDHPDNRDLLVTILGYRGHTMLQACDGAEALRTAQAERPDLIVTDLVMPVMDGYELVRELRRDPALAATRVIFYTANYLIDEVRPVAAALGVSHILAKPAEPGSLMATTEEVLAAASPAVELPPAEQIDREHLRVVSAKLAAKITDLQAAEESLRQSEARFRSLAESSPVGIFSLDRAGQVTYCNPRLLEICGLPGDPAGPPPSPDLLHDDDRAGVLGKLTAAIEATIPYRERVRIIRPSGEPRWADVHASPVREGSDEVTYVGTVEDVTDALAAQRQREELQARLRAQEAEARFRGLLEAAPDAVVCVGRDGLIALVNAQAERLFGYGREELTGQRVEILVPDAARASHPALRAGYMADPRPRPMSEGLELTARRRDGRSFPAEISLSTSGADDELLIMAAVRDVTEQIDIRAERERLRTEAERERLQNQLNQAQRLESLGELAGGVAHDFNNLLAVIANYAAFVAAELAGKEPQDDWRSMREDVQQIELAAARAAALTHQLLAFARREVIRPLALNLNEVIVDIDQLLARTLGEHIELKTNLAAELCPVLADPGQIEQVLVNLAVNARDAMPTGGSLTIRTAIADINGDHAAGQIGLDAGRYASLEISDTGTGMSQDVIDRAFEPFFTTKPKGAGTGLGLATIYGIVAQASGHIHIESEPGDGTTFAILLPAAGQPAEQAPRPQEAPRGSTGQTVLVVEDESALREVTRRILARNGYDVITAVDGNDALQIAASHTGEIDLLLTDVVMPHMLGREVGERIGVLHPAAKVLFMSGYTAGSLDTQGVLESDVDLIEKPFTEASLIAKVSEVMSAAI
jgi:PAS domain S-box-containing protein